MNSATKDPDKIFHVDELLFLKNILHDADFWKHLKTYQSVSNGDYDSNEDEPHTLQLQYLMPVPCENIERVMEFLKVYANQDNQLFKMAKYGETYLSSYLCKHQFTQLSLDSIFKYGDNPTLPPELFKCVSVKHLSLKYNYLEKLPVDIGRLTNLEQLSLTNNKLRIDSIPHTLIFCKRLKVLLLDNNLLDALPGHLLNMKSLDTVHRHGNHNYFKSTFMWYNRDITGRIKSVDMFYEVIPSQKKTLQFWAAKSLISTQMNFFEDPSVAKTLQDYISEIYSQFLICDYCGGAKLGNHPGFKVITFKNPYLGNTCVPFQHWACNIDCAHNIETPARKEQIQSAKELDRHYESYINECQQEYQREMYGDADDRTFRCRCSIM